MGARRIQDPLGWLRLNSRGSSLTIWHPGEGGGERSQGDFFLTLLISETEARDEEGGGDTGSAQ